MGFVPLELTADALQARRSRWAALALDIAERVFMVVLCAGIILRFLPNLGDTIVNGLLLASEGAVMVAILFRRPTLQVDHSLKAWVVALAGTTGGLLVTPGGPTLIAGWIAGVTIVAGLLLGIAAKVWLNRSFGIVAANRGVKRRGPYRLLRHPMYASYMIVQGTFLLTNFSTWNASVYILTWTAQVLRIRAEERMLFEDDAYRAYAAEVRWRLVPGLF